MTVTVCDRCGSNKGIAIVKIGTFTTSLAGHSIFRGTPPVTTELCANCQQDIAEEIQSWLNKFKFDPDVITKNVLEAFQNRS